jgi:hypothetical protein
MVFTYNLRSPGGDEILSTAHGEEAQRYVKWIGALPIYPKKLNTKKCNTIDPNAKSANALHSISTERIVSIPLCVPLWRDLFEFGAVLGVYLRPQAGGKHKLSHGTSKAVAIGS